jgi:UDP-N-acetylmuramate dehydrogenase
MVCSGRSVASTAMTPSITYNRDLQSLNTLATPAVAEAFCQLKKREELDTVLLQARQEGLPITVLGDGSNVVLNDRVPGLVLQLCTRGRQVLESDDRHVLLAVDGGENWHELVHWCLAEGYHGLENLALIPGRVGAAPIQNIGAYGVEVGQFITRVECRRLDSGERLSLSRQDCRFGYRDSIFKTELRDRIIVEQVTLRLYRQAAPVLDYPALARYLDDEGVDQPGPQELFDAVVAIRSSRLPTPSLTPNAGSFFKNPVLSATGLASLQAIVPDVPYYDRSMGQHVVPAAWLIERCGINAQSSVCLHPEHALVIINPQQSSASAVRAFAAQIVEAVRSHFEVQLEQEPRDYG